MEQTKGMGRDEKYEFALSSSFTLKMLIQGKQAGALQLLGIYSFLSWFLELRDRTSVGYTPFESALFVRLPNKPGNLYLLTVRLNQEPNLITGRKQNWAWP